MQTVLNQKPSCLLKGNLAFLLGEAIWISDRYLKLCDFFDNGQVSSCVKLNLIGRKLRGVGM